MLLIKSFVSLISLYLLLFDLDLPFIRGFGSAFLSFIINIIFFIILNKSKFLIKYKINLIIKEFNLLIGIFIILFLYSCIRILFDNAEDISYLGTTLKSSIIFLSSLSYILVFGLSNTNNILFYNLLNVFFINASIALFVGTFQEYQSYVDMFKPQGGTELIGWTPYRNAFLSGAGYFGIGAPFGVASVFFLTYLLTVLNNKNLFFNFSKLIIIIIASIFAARTVFFCLVIAIFYLFIIKKSIKSIFFVSIITIAILFLLNLEIFSEYKLWLFEIFEKGVSESDSGSALFSTHMNIPDKFITWLFGDGRYINPLGGYYMGTDIGYLRHLYFGGVFFMLLVISIPFNLFLKNKNKLFLFVIIPTCLLLHFKGIFIYNNPASTPLLIMISHILYTNKMTYKKAN